MPHQTQSCQLPRARTGDSRQKSPTLGGIPRQSTGANAAPSATLNTRPAHQWISTTTGRITTDAHSWMTAVHWTGDSGLYKPTRTHGPGWGPTTILIAKEISALKECRPGIDYLARKLKISERTVQYHLGMLREAGLLVYRTKGTRISRSVNQASVFERIIPTVFDEALGIRTMQRDDTAPAYTRVPIGIAEKGRKLIGKLAKKAARKPRRRTRKRSDSRGPLCTPMQGGTSAFSTAGTTYSPPESKLASGDTSSPTPQQQKPKARRKLNKVGRRHQLAAEFAAIAPWCSRASHDRLSWILRHVADAGWTALEVQAIAEDRGPLIAAGVRRPTGMLAHRIKGAHLLYTTKAQRKTAVLAWQESRAAEHARHDGYEQGITNGRANSQSVRNIAQKAINRTRAGLVGPVDDADCDLIDTTDPEATQLEDLDRELVLGMRKDAEADPAVITSALATGMTETDARRLFTHRLVDRALTLDRLADRDLTPAF
ncbi:helix-turn-helix domain-containing protein [Streptomyces scopuliridis]|uniref:helix-turn-helix domain-containing protein n=1 Tax=Streptomyces scopuliridis TaxID=452529 RepID=UPI00341EA6E4